MVIRDFAFHLVNISCLPSSVDFNAIVRLDGAVEEALPFLNAAIRGGHYAHDKGVFDFMLRRHIVTVIPGEMRVTGLKDREHALRVIQELIEVIEDVWQRRHELTPAFQTIRPPATLDVLRELPQTNCGACGVPTCMAFAVRLIQDGEPIGSCPELNVPERRACRAKLLELLSDQEGAH